MQAIAGVTLVDYVTLLMGGREGRPLASNYKPAHARSRDNAVMTRSACGNNVPRNTETGVFPRSDKQIGDMPAVEAYAKSVVFEHAAHLLERRDLSYTQDFAPSLNRHGSL
jgi:hypothetical protein